MSQDYPFRFYGADPSEWEGDGYSYEVHFRTPPTEAERVAIARAFESELIGTDVETTVAELRWAADWAHFRVERKPGADDFDYELFFEDICGAFEAVNRAAPIEEVVFVELIDLEDETGGSWHKWSVAEKSIPGEAPNWDGGELLSSLFAARQKRFDASPIVDAAAEAARREVWAAAAKDAAKEVAKVKAAAVAEARIVFETPKKDPPVPAHISGDTRDAWRYGNGFYCDTRAPAGCWLYAQRAEDGAYELFIGDDKKLEPFEPTLRAPDVRWAYGRDSLFIWDGSAIHEVDLTTRRVQRRMALATAVEAMATLAGALAVLVGEDLTEQQLVIYELGDELRERLRIPAAGKSVLNGLLGGKVLSVHAGALWGDNTVLLAYEDGGFHVIGASAERLSFVWEADGAVFAQREDRHKSYFEIQNLEAARVAALQRATGDAPRLGEDEVYTNAPPYKIEVIDDEGGDEGDDDDE